MKKKVGIAVLVLMLVSMGNLFAQDVDAGGGHRNWVSGYLGILTLGARYERMFTPNLSAGASVYVRDLFVQAAGLFWVEDIGIDVFARWYPWAGNFFAGLAAGVLIRTIYFDDPVERHVGMSIAPEVGWRIDVGEPGGFFLAPVIRLHLAVGVPYEIPVAIVPKLGMGFAW